MTRTTTVGIADLAEQYRWVASSVGRQVVEAADGAAKGYTKDGKISLTELDAALKKPTAAELLSTKAIATLAATLGKTPKKTDALPQGFRALAEGADSNADHALSQEELALYIDAARKKGGSEIPALTTQRLAVLRSQIAFAAGRSDYLADTQKTSTQTVRPFFRSHYRGVWDDVKKIPVWVSYVLDATDNALRTDLTRKDAFRGDTELAIAGVGSFPAWYNNSGFDMGHHMPYEDYSNGVAARDSFLMSNMAPQTSELNSNVWRFMESGIRQLVDVTRGSAVVFTGGLFLDAELKRLPEDQVKWVGPDAADPTRPKRVAVPTHFFKAVLLTLPNGKQTSFAWCVPNRADVPTHKAKTQEFLAKHVLSVKQLEAIAGFKMFAGLGERSSVRTNSEGLTPLAAHLFGGKAPLLDANNTKPGASYDEIGLLFPKTPEGAPALLVAEAAS